VAISKADDSSGWKAWPRGLCPLCCSLDFARNDKLIEGR
jgi:hypothetical protein